MPLIKPFKCGKRTGAIFENVFFLVLVYFSFIYFWHVFLINYRHGVTSEYSYNGSYKA